ncbi:sensor domain-containing diguanylate cyclase [Pusillimonas minor]|uniref:Diguanylate cyclase n=1 Tax=Pusillimonas minor TaxID=2697024 RepID=A0A842HJF6_9BURK|nr:sensor domain-containing diguanylate cyclase [Pusillimonas minor]MBC2768353.1 diguanylate cyclase [Pusillimonas minor]
MALRLVAQSILFRLVVVGLGLILVGSTVRYFALSGFLRDDMAEVVSSQQMSLATYVANDIGHKILMRQYRLQQLANTLTPASAEYDADLDRAFGRSAPFEALFSAGLLLTTTDGRVLRDTTTFKWHGRPLSLVPNKVLHGVSEQAAHIGKPLVIAGQISPILPMTLALVDHDNVPWGYLTGFTILNSPDFMGNLMQARLGSTGSGFLLISPDDQIFIAASNPKKVLTATPPPGVNRLHDKAMLGYRGTGVTINAHGVEEISAMASVPNTSWFVVSAIATAEALGTVERVKDYLLRNTLLTVLFLFASLAVVVPFTLRPLTQATRQADKMSRGLAPLAPLSGADKGEVGVLISAFNRLLLKLQDQQNELSRAAHHDSLTGLPNRRLLADHLKTALAAARRSHETLGLIFIDLDQFKPVNDTLGHEAGDKVLQLVAQRLSGLVRESDVVARLGGDEFVILLTQLGAEAQARQAVENTANQVISTLKQPFDVAGVQCELGASLGAVISDGQNNASDLMRWADMLMYQAKARGKGQCIVKSTQEVSDSGML